MLSDEEDKTTSSTEGLETVTDGDLFSVPGWRGAATRTGVKPSGKLDLAVIVADEPMTVAGVFTTSDAIAPPVQLTRERIASSPVVRSIVVNSGNANALTGTRGRRDAESMAETLEQTCGGPALVLSTGIIGVPLPVAQVNKGIRTAGSELDSSPGDSVARAILTTDSSAKTCAVKVTVGDATYTVGGIAKGSGMIHPNMATMLAVIATDAPIGHIALRSTLVDAVDHSFHEISVDGDTSTNDAVLLMARPPGPDTPGLYGDELAAVGRAVRAVAEDLALKVVRDGEGASRIMHVEITSARNREEAKKVARGVANSSLVKTALAGGDPNWGRIISAAGASGADIDVAKLSLEIGGHVIYRDGGPQPIDAESVGRAFNADEVTVRIDLAQGEARGRCVTTDLTKEYVEINSEYTT